MYPQTLDLAIIIGALSCMVAVILYYDAVLPNGSDRLRRWTVAEAQLMAGLAVVGPPLWYGLDDTGRALWNFAGIGLVGWAVCACYLVFGIGSPALSMVALHRISRTPSSVAAPARVPQLDAVVIPLPVGRRSSD